jgi:hypothetical protein
VFRGIPRCRSLRHRCRGGAGSRNNGSCRGGMTQRLQIRGVVEGGGKGLIVHLDLWQH